MAKRRPNPKSKASRAEVAARVAEILEIRLDGASFGDCVTYGTEKGWNVSERQVGRYIEQADKLLAERTEKRRRRLLNMHVARREKLFARAVNAADLRTALAVLADQAKLQNLYTSDADIRELIKTTAALELQFKQQQLQDEGRTYESPRHHPPPAEAPQPANEPAAADEGSHA
jgi:hypothetical protein